MTHTPTLSQQKTVEDTAWTCAFERLPWDSEHFGLSIGRLNPLKSPHTFIITEEASVAGAQLIEQVSCEAEKQGTKLIYAVAECDDNLTQRALNKAKYILMDTLVTHRLTRSALCSELKECANVRLAVEADLPALQKISVEGFADRRYNVNRFNSEPCLDQNKVVDLYSKWLQNSLNGKMADETFVYVEGQQVLGFVTLNLPKTKGDDAAIALNAVDSKFHGRGIYTKMVHHVVRRVFNDGIEGFEIKTQLPNVSVHRAWARIGAAVIGTQHRFHRTAEK